MTVTDLILLLQLSGVTFPRPEASGKCCQAYADEERIDLMTLTQMFVLIFTAAALQFWPTSILFAWLDQQNFYGNPHQAVRPSRGQIYREVWIAWRTIAVSAATLLLPFYFFSDHVQGTKAPLIESLLVLVLLFLLHDTYFYWIHRWFHSKSGRWLHDEHHVTVTSVLTAYRMTALEVVLQNLFMVAMLFLLPIYGWVYHTYVFCFLLHNLYNHCGRELYPRWLRRSFLGHFLLGSTAHNFHHATGSMNYALYFTHWDRWMNTLSTHSNAVRAG